MITELNHFDIEHRIDLKDNIDFEIITIITLTMYCIVQTNKNLIQT